MSQRLLVRLTPPYEEQSTGPLKERRSTQLCFKNTRNARVAVANYPPDRRLVNWEVTLAVVVQHRRPVTNKVTVAHAAEKNYNRERSNYAEVAPRWTEQFYILIHKLSHKGG